MATRKSLGELPELATLVVAALFGLSCLFVSISCDSSIYSQSSSANGKVVAVGSQRSVLPAGQLFQTKGVSEEPLEALQRRSRRSPIAARLGSKRLPPRVLLAQRPPTRTTTTTTTSTTTTSTASSAEAGGQAEETGSGGAIGAPADTPPEESNGEAADEYEDIEPTGGGRRVASSSTTSTSTTTLRPTGGASSQRGSGSQRRGEKSRVKQTTPKTTTTQKPAEEEEEEAEEEVEEELPTSTQTIGVEKPTTSDKANASKIASPVLHARKRPMLALPFIKAKNASVCVSEAYLEFPQDLIGNKWRGRGLVIIHLAVVCYMFYSLALVCERYFMPSLEEFAQRLQLSEDVAGATLMSAGSSAPELFTAILGVFVAKGDVGTGAIVGSAVFNILFVIGLCAFVSTTTAQLQWWPVFRDSIYYTLTVLALILIIYDERVTAIESFAMIALYGLYIVIMMHNQALKEYVTRLLAAYPKAASFLSGNSIDFGAGPDDVFGSSSSAPTVEMEAARALNGQRVEDDSMYLAALLVVLKHKRLFRPTTRFQSAARYIIVKRQHRNTLNKQGHKLAKQQNRFDEVNYFEADDEAEQTNARKLGSSSQRSRMEAYAKSSSISKNKFSIVSKDDYEFWNRPPGQDENYYLWLAKIPVNYVLHYTCPDCSLYPDRYLLAFFVSIFWTAVFSYIMVWMVTLIGYTFGIPDSVMGVTFLAAGTSIPDCYSSIHAARNGMADMAVSNSIGSNVFDILIGLAVPWFIQSAIYPGVVATINSRGIIYSVVLLFLSLVVTIYLLNKFEWTLKPRLGLALLVAYGLFIILTCLLEFNFFGHVNPPPCPVV